MLKVTCRTFRKFKKITPFFFLSSSFRCIQNGQTDEIVNALYVSGKSHMLHFSNIWKNKFKLKFFAYIYMFKKRQTSYIACKWCGIHMSWHSLFEHLKKNRNFFFNFWNFFKILKIFICSYHPLLHVVIKKIHDVLFI